MADAAEPSARRKLFKYATLALGVVVLTIGGAIAYFVLTFDAREYRDYIVRAVKEKTGRTLRIDGEMYLSLWPDVAVRIGRLSLSERTTDEPFLSVEKARVRLALLPLFSREVVGSELVLTNARVVVIRYEDGRLNIDDLLGGEGPAPRFEIARFNLEHSTLVYRDLARRTRYEFSDIDLQTGRIANETETPLAINATVRSDEHDLLLRVDLRGELKLDLDGRQYALTSTAVDVKGRVSGLTEVVAVLNGDAALRVKSHELQLDGGGVRGTARRAGDEVQLDARAAKLLVTPPRTITQDLRAAIVLNGASAKAQLNVRMPTAELDGDRVQSPNTALELTLHAGQHTIKTSASSAIEASIAARTLTLSDLDGTLNVAGPQFPRKGVPAAFKGAIRADLHGEAVHMNLAGKVGASALEGQFAMTGFAAPVYEFAVKIDELDLDDYLPYIGNVGSVSEKRAVRPEGDLLEALSHIPASGTLTVGVLKSTDAKARNVRLEIR
jgi:AsmA protein